MGRSDVSGYYSGILNLFRQRTKPSPNQKFLLISINHIP